MGPPWEDFVTTTMTLNDSTARRRRPRGKEAGGKQKKRPADERCELVSHRGANLSASLALGVVDDITSCLAGIKATRKLLEDACIGSLAKKCKRGPCLRQTGFAALKDDNEKSGPG